MFLSLHRWNVRSVLSGTTLTVVTMLALAGAAAFAFSKPIAADREQTCFNANIDHPSAARIARNTVFIAKVRPDGTLISAATGFLVRDAEANEPRIVTAAHVVNNNRNNGSDTTLMVFLSDGAPVGVPQVIAMTAQRQISIADNDLVVNDVAVLTMAHFSDEAVHARFAGLDGLPVHTGGALMVGETDGRAGVIWGYSGAAAIDRAGEIIGVAIGADFRGRITQNLEAIQGADADDHSSHEVTLPNRSLVLVEPLGAPEILRALGLSEAEGNEPIDGSVVLAGFPFASCASTSAQLQIADSADGVTLLKKWQRLDQTGSWWLPSFGDKKLRLVARSPIS
jgi:hypothetical protein